MKKENLRFVQMSNYTSPVVKEIRGKDWVEYGEDNNYFQYLIDIYTHLLKVLGKDLQPVFAPERNGDIKHSNADISKAIEMLGYDPEWSFERGIEAAIEWYKENLDVEAGVNL